ncbi:hypothetical protein [Burkholderia stagnalis]|uniref:hypothetical protein n=1 Tax=Burkholderia stagnalis TaxID=1503054 RepID=UPI000ABFDE68|nr:hypothetical protein [Burkholderia stagnalis]MDY7807334.1 hypothetical protein [Burkholderia stagnalis]
MLLSSTSIDGLRNLGLCLSDEPSFAPDHRAYPSGYLVIKPASVQGNALPGFRGGFRNGHVLDETDAPAPVIWNSSGRWRVAVQLFAPGPGPGDFVKEFADEAEAVHFIVQYFFHETPEFSARLAYDRKSFV